MHRIKRRKTPTVVVGSVLMGSQHPIVVQSMTNTPTEHIKTTVQQIQGLVRAGSDLVRITVNNDKAAQATPKIIRRLKDNGCDIPIIGDFHYNGHKLLTQYPQAAATLAKYRINPGNLGRGRTKDKNFDAILKIAKEHNKPVRIGINWGSIDPELFSEMVKANNKRKNPKTIKEITYQAMIKSALMNARHALKMGLKKDKIVLSVKMSLLQDMVNVYSRLALKCDFALHLGLTEAGGDLQGTVSSTAALAILLQKGIGDTIRVSLTPQKGIPRSCEVEVCKNLLQSMGLRYFEPTVISCPGCGRTASTKFQNMATSVKKYVHKRLPTWKKLYPGVEQSVIAVMGCIVNGPGESKHADIGISLPGSAESSSAPVYTEGKLLKTLRGKNIPKQFENILEAYVQKRFS